MNGRPDDQERRERVWPGEMCDGRPGERFGFRLAGRLFEAPHTVVTASAGEGKGGSCRRCGSYVQAGPGLCPACGEEVA